MSEASVAFFLTTAQVSLGLAAFSAVVVGLRREGHTWTDFECLQIRGTIEVGFFAVILSLLPFLIHFCQELPGKEFPPRELLPHGPWYIANLVMGLFIVTYVSTYIYRRRNVRDGGNPGSKAAAWIRAIVCGLLAALTVASSLGVSWPPPLAVYAASLVWLLTIVMVGFVMILRLVGLSAP